MNEHKDDQWLENATHKDIWQEIQCLRQANVTLVEELEQLDIEKTELKEDYHRQNQELLQVALSLASVTSENNQLIMDICKLKSNPVMMMPAKTPLIHPSAKNNPLCSGLFWAITLLATLLLLAWWIKEGTS